MFDLQKASVIKRISAFLLDAILFIILATTFAALLSKPLGYQAHTTELNARCQAYYDQCGIKNTDLTQEEYNLLSAEEKAAYEAADNAIRQDVEIRNLELSILKSALLILALSFLLTFLALEFLVPLLLHNGQTVGKKIFGIGLCRVDCVKITPFQLFVRTVIGKYAIETMVPILLVVMLITGLMGLMSLIVIALFGILQIVLLIASRTNSLIHDALAVTVAVDLSSQALYDTSEALLEAKKQAAADQAQKTPY